MSTLRLALRLWPRYEFRLDRVGLVIAAILAGLWIIHPPQGSDHR